MSEHGVYFDQTAFVTELDDVADLLKAARPGHDAHQGWSLRSTRVLTCGCGEVLYRPDGNAPGRR